MHLIENYELRTPGVLAFQLRVGSEIRVVTGRLWLTLEGFPEDVWLQAGEAWTLPANGRLWLSAEPVADFRIVRFTAARQPMGGLPYLLSRIKRQPQRALRQQL
jgi:hypothetical protein